MKPPTIKSRVFIFLTVGFLFFSFTGRTQESEAKDDAFTKMKDLVSSRNYVFEAEEVLPLSGRSKVLNYLYTLEVSDSTARANLPYFGVGYSNIGYGGDISVRFEGQMQDYTRKVKENKERILITFRIYGDRHGRYDCSLSVTKSGSARLHVVPDNRQSISYWGDIREAEKD